MSAGIQRSRLVLVVLVAATLLLGALAGLILGWQVWPVHWLETDPSDLRLTHQISYVLMTADSFVVTNDTAAARERLAELMDQHTSWEQVSNLVAKVAAKVEAEGNAAAAARVRRLADGVDLPSPYGPDFVPPSQRAATPWWLPVALAVAGIALLVILVLALRQALAFLGGGVPEYLPDEDLDEAEDLYSAGAAWRDVPSQPPMPEQAQPEPQRAQVVQPTEPLEEENPPEVPFAAAPGEPYPASSSSRMTTRPLAEARDEPLAAATREPHIAFREGPPVRDIELAPEPTTVTAVSHRVSAPPPGALGVFHAEYHFGDDDLDLSFVIQSPEKEFLGECGIGIIDVLRTEGGQQVDAFEIWLFDRGDARAEAKAILVSDWAFRNPAASARLGTRGRPYLAQPSLQITLETLSLRLTTTIEDFGYVTDSQPTNSYFSHLTLELVAERRAGS
jgi:hypothetical protein